MMHYTDLRDFIQQLETRGELKRVALPVSPHLEMTALSDKCLHAQGPALLFENPTGYDMPVLTNLFGTTTRVALGMGQTDLRALRQVGELLAYLKEPEPPTGFYDAIKKIPLLKQVMTMSPKVIDNAPCQTIVYEHNDVDLTRYPIQTCWPGDVAPLITWGLVITKGPEQARTNLGIYRQQVLAKNKVIMRWLAHRGGALDFQAFKAAHPGERFPVAVALGTDPATMLAAVCPIPDQLSEYAFAGLLRGKKTLLTKALSHDLLVPAHAEIVLEGFIDPNETALEGPYGDHTGYYNEQEYFPVLTVERITQRANAIYHSTYTGKPPDEPAMLGVALNEVLIPLLQLQFPEIIDFYLPPEACSYRLAVVSIKKKYPGHAKRILFAVWSYLKQFMYTKFVIVVDDDIDARNWQEVVWALSTRMDPVRDVTLIENTPIDYLDFASPVSGLGGKMGLDATNKWPGETTREWGRPIMMDPAVTEKAEVLWQRIFVAS